MPHITTSYNHVDSAVTDAHNDQDESERLIKATGSFTGGVGRHSVAGSTRSSVLGRQYSGAYINTGYDSRDADERASIHASDSGLQIHAEPSATLFSTFLNITCNIVGVGVLAIPTAVENSSLGFGVLLIFAFQFFSTFSSYVLSVGCEYTQFFSQSQLLCHCLTGYADPFWDDDLDGEIEEGGMPAGSMDNMDMMAAEAQRNAIVDESRNDTSNNKNENDNNDDEEYGGYGGTATSAVDKLNVDDGNKSNASSNNLTPAKKLMKRSSSPGSSTPMMTSPEKEINFNDGTRVMDEDGNLIDPKKSSSSSNNNNNNKKNKDNNNNDDQDKDNNGNNVKINNNKKRKVAAEQMNNSSMADLPTEHDVAVAEDKAVRSQRTVNLVIDVVLGSTYFCYLVAYARVVSDSMCNVSKDIGLPGFAATKICWLLIGGAVFLLLSMRRVFQEMKITSIIGITTIYFVIICLIIRFVHPDNFQPDRNSPDFGEVKWWALSGNFLNAFSTLSGSFGYQVNHPSFYQELKVRNPAVMQKPVVVSMTLISLTYCLTGILGYMMFGPAINSKQVGGDIVNGFGADDLLINIARVGLFVHFVCVYPLLCCAVRQCMHRVGLRLLGQHERSDDPDEVFKVPFSVIAVEVFLIVVASVVLAAVVPGIGIVINIGGCLGGTFSLMILPSIVGMYIFPELETRLADNDESVTQVLSSVEMNNFAGFCQFNFSFKTLYRLSVVGLIVGVTATVGGFVVILQGL